jgi:hypothetical protein
MRKIARLFHRASLRHEVSRLRLQNGIMLDTLAEMCAAAGMDFPSLP